MEPDLNYRDPSLFEAPSSPVDRTPEGCISLDGNF